ncbi:MAG TPA: hypothetical protein PK728_07130 [Bacillota bacterium]|nr:hypothetical protein [Bacillota bacterium]
MMKKFEVVAIASCAYSDDNGNSFCAIVKGPYSGHDQAYVPAIFHDWKEAGKLYGRTVKCLPHPELGWVVDSWK